MPRLLRITFAVSLGLALLVPATGGAQEPPPAETAPPPPTTTTPQDPIVQIEPPPVVTIKVPPLPKPKPAAKKAKVQRAKPAPREPVRRSSPRRSVRVWEPEPVAVAPRAEVEAPVAETKPAKPAAVKPKPKPKPKPHRKKVVRANPRVVAKAAAPPARTIRDPDRAGAVLAAQFSMGDDPAQAAGTGVGTGMVVAAVLFAVFLGTAVGIVGTAPLLADRWPKVFEPVIDATDQIVLVGVWIAGLALTLAVTWALTSPGG